MTKEEAIKILKGAIKKPNTKDEYLGQALDMAIKALEQEPKTGHWIEEINDYGEITGWHCDKCYEDSGFTTTCKWDFCPNCGAKMTESEEKVNEF